MPKRSFSISRWSLTFFGLGLTQPVLVTELHAWMGLARQGYGEVRRGREALSMAATHAESGPTAGAVATAGLSFLAVGIQQPNIGWAELLTGPQNYRSPSPWLAVYPGALILITVVAFNLLGDSLRDASNPKAL